MSFPFKIIGIVPKTSYQGINDIVESLVTWFQNEGCSVICIDDVLPGFPIEHVSKERFQQESELIVVLGGDGTFLGAGRLAMFNETPLLGINLGRLGFLTEITLDEWPQTLDVIKEGKYTLERRHLLHARVVKDGQITFEGHVINDAVVNKTDIARILELESRVNQTFLATFKADGLIISTPTGSTAYSLAAGGPIVFPTMEAIIMTPISPHSLTHRPLVIPDHLNISVHVPNFTRNVSLTLDGQLNRTLQEGEHVEISKSPYHLNVVKSPTKSYFEILRNKLRWAKLD